MHSIVHIIFGIPFGVCKFNPNCSAYVFNCFEILPLHVAVIKSVWRILRCNPWSKGGYDPVK